MFRRTFKVVYRPMKNNFIHLPPNYYTLVSSYENGCLSLTYGGKHVHYATWVPHSSGVKETEIGINAKVAKEIGLKENDLVKIALLADVMPLKSVYATPVSPHDWEIIELSSEKLQTTLLDQARVVNSSQVLVVWMNKSMKVALNIDRLKPNTSYGRLEYDTELIVAPNITQNGFTSNQNDFEDTSSLQKSQTSANLSSKSNALCRSTSFAKDNHTAPKVNKAERLARLVKDLKRESSRTYEFRVISGKWEGPQISDIFVTRNNLPEFMDLEQTYLLKTANDKEFYVNIKVISESDGCPNSIHPVIEINENLMKLLKIKELEKVSLRPKQVIMNFVEKIDLFANKKTNYKMVERAFKQYITDKTKLFPLLLNQDQVIRLEEEDLYITVQITPEYFKYCLLDAAILKECKIYAADEIVKIDHLFDITPPPEKTLSVKDYIPIRKFDKIIDTIIEKLKLNLCLDERNSVLRHGNFLIAGHANAGKTVIVERILEKLSAKPICCFYDIYHCTRNKGRKPESIHKDLRQIFTSCLNNAPSLIVLENLDVLAHSVGEHQTQDGEYFNRIADIVQHMIIEFTTNNPIAVIATVSSVPHLNRRLYTSRGRHLFHVVEQIPDLERDDRETILDELCAYVECDNLNLDKFANLTEGYNIGDLVQFIERGIFYAYRINRAAPVLTNELLAKSLENTNSYCLQGIENHNRIDVNVEENEMTATEVPGMEDVITVLEEVLMWPSKYPTVFENSPLRNQAGVLLFGPPGTGKTFLVSQISSSWNLRTISVKGPELLAKYIGQSEENVRNLFEKARSAKPCVLFFDEFDSLAPKRGHDSTGVTDRVVNQLLTELDGVEGLQGVTVIAATSRPELLDPALLRSGRIDRLVECTLPNTVARCKIFETLSHSLNLDKTVDFKYFAARTENYTGADIQSILTSANMAAVKETLAKCGEKKVPEKIYITQAHLIESFKSTRPSLNGLDIAKYKQTYARFTNKEKQPLDFVSQRATLA